jgi:raffinose/stachyose/melibiose transport system permease protein
MVSEVNMRRRKITLWIYIAYLFLIINAALCLFPLFWTLLSSLKNNTEILMHTMQLPSKMQWNNYADAWRGGDMIRYYINTLGVALATTTISLLFASMATYVVAIVMPNLGIYSYFVAGLILPSYVIMLPLFKNISSIGLGNNLAGLTIIFISLMIPQSFFILYGYMKGIPRELEEAAIIDGCRRAGIFYRIILPLSKPGLGTVGIFTLLFSWNEYLLPLVMISGDQKMVLSMAIQQFKTSYLTNYGGMMARLTLAILPVIIIYLLFQNSVIKGVTAGAVKG